MVKGMNEFLDRAKELYTEMVENRRHVHQNAEVGMDLPKTAAFVRNKLESYGYEVRDCGGGLTCTVGTGGKVLMLRADMDALPQQEVSGEPFACTTGACHSCGHDTHTAMLLAAAKMLKEKESELKGTVKFMFEAGEEVLKGASAMIADGILENPKVDAAMALHCAGLPTGTLRVFTGAMRGAREFTVTIQGKESHGAAPHRGVSALSVAANIVVQVQQMIAMETDSEEVSILTFGAFHAGDAPNINPGEAVLKGTMRAYNMQHLSFMQERFETLVTTIAEAYRAKAEISYGGVVPFENKEALVREMFTYMQEVSDHCILMEENDKGTDDFAFVSQKVPTMQFNLGTGSEEEGYLYGGHDPRRTLNEEGMITGTACLVTCAVRWLSNHSN